MRTYLAARMGLAQLGHTVHVITNAKEAGPPYRMFMRTQDLGPLRGALTAPARSRCTGPIILRAIAQWHIPASMPFVTKLASLRPRAHAEGADRPDLCPTMPEPYCVASHTRGPGHGPAACRAHRRQRRRPAVAPAAIPRRALPPHLHDRRPGDLPVRAWRKDGTEAGSPRTGFAQAGHACEPRPAVYAGRRGAGCRRPAGTRWRRRPPAQFPAFGEFDASLTLSRRLR